MSESESDGSHGTIARGLSRLKETVTLDGGEEITTQRTLDPDSEYVTIVATDDDGHGTALVRVDDGIDVVSFTGSMDVYESTWIPGADLDDFANAVSVEALEMEVDS